MPPVPAGVEERTRVTCSLPLVQDPDHPGFEPTLRSFARVLQYVESQQRYDIGVDGYTVSQPGAYMGRWQSSTTGQWVADDLAVLIIDYRLPLSDGSIWVKLRELRIELLLAYPSEEEIWINATPVFRQAAPTRQAISPLRSHSLHRPDRP